MAGDGAPEIFRTDQGGPYTREAFPAVLLAYTVNNSMDGKGLGVDNVLIERLWRRVKDEDVYLRASETSAALRTGLMHSFQFFNRERRHQPVNH